MLARYKTRIRLTPHSYCLGGLPLFPIALAASKMSFNTASSQKHEWIVILPDHKGALEQRMRVRP